MKRILPILLMILLLAGCGNSETPETTPVSAEPTAAPKATVYLESADNGVEQQTNGAVRAYRLEATSGTRLLPMGNELLVICDDGSLTLLEGESCEVAATGKADLSEDGTAGELIAWSGGVMYFNRENREVVMLDSQLRESLTVSLPEESLGDPLLQSSGEIFYCTDSQIRALDVRTGISRLVRQHNCIAQDLMGSYFDDSLIGCRITDESGTVRTVYLYADTGEAVYTDTSGYRMETSGQLFFARQENNENPCIFGWQKEEPMYLYANGETLAGVLTMEGAVGYTAAEDGLHLNLYDLNTGMRTSEVLLNGVSEPDAVTADGEYVWLTAEGVLYRWDVSAIQIADETVYTGQRYTAENPDTEGLAECQAHAQRLQDTYGLSLYIWNDAAEQAKEYAENEEYRVSVIQDALEQIEVLLQQFPENFVKDTGNISVYIVNSLKSGEPYEQYWDGSNCCVVLNCSEVTKSFLTGLGVAIDTKVLGNSREFDTWSSLNPKGFSYTYDYEANELREDAEKYEAAFIDQRSMSFPTEDRSRIFAYAVLPGQEEYFTGDTLQQKLERVCEAIREAYDLEQTEAAFIWEQYLDESIS